MYTKLKLTLLVLSLLLSCSKSGPDAGGSQGVKAGKAKLKIKESLTKGVFNHEAIEWKSKAGTTLKTVAIITPEINQSKYYKWKATEEGGANKTFQGIGYHYQMLFLIQIGLY